MAFFFFVLQKVNGDVEISGWKRLFLGLWSFFNDIFKKLGFELEENGLKVMELMGFVKKKNTLAARFAAIGVGVNKKLKKEKLAFRCVWLWLVESTLNQRFNTDTNGCKYGYWGFWIW